MSRLKVSEVLKKIVITAVFACCCFAGLFGRGDVSTYAITTTDTTSYVTVGELWNSSNKRFNYNNVNILMKYLTGNASADLSDVASLVSNATNNQYSAASIRASSLVSGAQGNINYAAKSSSQDIVVTLGGLTWTVTYLSSDMDGNPILTLWLSNSTQSAWLDRAADEGEFYGFINGGLYSDWSYNYNDDYFNKKYPSTVYGSSYINAVTLNNGGMYSTSISTTPTSPAEKNPNSVFAEFTMANANEADLTDFLVTPSRVMWQQYQSAKTSASMTYSYPNDAWGSVETSSDDEFGNEYKFYENARYGQSNYSTLSSNPHSNNATWADNYLWLPSIAEVGQDNSKLGLWGISISQRSNYDGSTTSALGSVGGANGKKSGSAYARAWLRSGYTTSAGKPYALYPNGSTITGDYANNSAAVRPALHLNLNAVMTNPDYVEVGEIWDRGQAQMNEDNVNKLLSYITGNAENTLASISTLASTPRTAAQIRDVSVASGEANGVGYIDKISGQDIVVTLGDLKWTVTYLSKDVDGNPILTLWLDDCFQYAWYDREEYGDYHYLINGKITSKWSYNITNSGSFSSQYPTNLYGSSYINAVTLNNGGVYAISDSDIVESQKNPYSVFAEFTMDNPNGLDLTDYLVTPSKVRWQEYQSAASAGIGSDSYPNDAWGSDVCNEKTDDPYGNTYNFYVWNGHGNYSQASANPNQYNESWKNSFLWLPSTTETGYSDAKLGMWGLSIAQRRSVSDSWLRSGGYYYAPYYANYLNWSGQSNYVDYTNHYNSFGVRPALHLNLAKVLLKLKDISDGNVGIQEANVVYDGQNKTPVITVNYDGETLIKDADYKVTYILNGESVSQINNVGVYTINVTGMGNYVGLLTTTYTVSARDFSSLDISAIGSQVYTGFVIEPEVEIDYEIDLVNGVDYSIEYLDNINVGEASIKIKGIGNFTGEATTTFEIVTRNINEAIIDLVSDKMLPGGELSLVMSYLGKVLVKGTDYTMTYSNQDNYGDCQVAVVAKGNWHGSRLFRVEVADLYAISEFGGDVDLHIPMLDVVYDGVGSRPDVRLTNSHLGNKVLIEGTDYSLKFYRDSRETSDFASAGVIDVEITGIGDYSGTIIRAYRIFSRNISTVEVSAVGAESYMISAMDTAEAQGEITLGDFVYTGKPIEPEIVLSFNAMTLVDGADYSIEYSNNIEPGLAIITINGANNYSGARTVSFNIIKATPNVVCYNSTETRYVGEDTLGVLLLCSDVSGEFVVEEEALKLGKNSYGWTFIPEDTTRYNQVSGTTVLEAIKDYVERIEVNTSKVDYSVYSAIDKADIVAVSVYASGRCVELGANDYYIDLGSDGKLTVDDEVRIRMVGEKVYGVCDVNIKPLKISVAFDNYVGLLATGEHKRIDVTVSGEVDPNIDPELQVIYTNLRTGTYSDKIEKYGTYKVEVYSLNPNYEIVGDRAVEFVVEFAAIPAWLLALVTFITVAGTVAIIGTIIYFKNRNRKRLTD